jgi:hypothetical protein
MTTCGRQDVRTLGDEGGESEDGWCEADAGSNGRMGPTLTYADDSHRVKSRRVLHSSTKVEVD